MLFEKRFWEGLRDGRVTLAFRRWKRPTVKAGGTLRSPGGVLAIEDVRPIAEDAIGEDDALRAGFESRAALLGALPEAEHGRRLYRIAFHREGTDPRVALRNDVDLDASDIAEIRARLDRLDAYSPELPWTRPALRLIGEAPGTAASELAGRLGCDKPWLERKIRKLKELGLTESLDVGYRLSPRGKAVVEALAT